MIDTIRLGMAMPLPTRAEMKRSGFTAKGAGYFKNVSKCGRTISLQASDRYDSYFGVTCSAAKLINGNNVETLTDADLPFLLDTISDIVANEAPLDFDANRADVTAIHFCHNWQLGNELDVYAHLDQMKVARYPYKTRDICGKEHGVDTVYFSNRSEEILLYPKHAETGRQDVGAELLAKSIGILRWEHRLLKASKVAEIAARFGCARRADSFLLYAPEMVLETILTDMKILNLDKTISVTGERDRADRLMEYCGSNTVKFGALMGFLYECDIYGIDNLVSLKLVNPKTLGNRRRELAKAGISLAKPSAGRVLHPLPIPDFAGGNADDTPFNKTKLCSPQGTIAVLHEARYVH